LGSSSWQAGPSQRSLPKPGYEYIDEHIRPTSVHIPKELLLAVDRKARGLRVSRNRLIIRALEREVSGGIDWSPDFFSRLRNPGSDLSTAADETLMHIRERRKSRKPVDL
jgi:hypothetical protein